MTDNTLKTNNTQQVEPEFRPLTKEEAEMLLEEAKNWKEPEYDDYDAYNTYETSCDVGFPPALKKKPSAEEYAKQIDKTGFEKKGLYKGIVQVEDDFRRIRLIKAYRERAKELGGTQMAKFFDEMLKTAKKEWMEGEKMGMKKKNDAGVRNSAGKDKLYKFTGRDAEPGLRGMLGSNRPGHIFQRAGEVYQGLQPVGIDYRNPPFSRERGGDSQTGISEEQEMEEDRGGQRNPGIPPEDNRTV